MSIRLRLTLLYSAILVLTLIVFSTVLYAAQARYTLNMIRQDLSKVADPLALMLTRTHQVLGNPPWRGQPDDIQSDQARRLVQPFMRNMRTRDTVRVLNPYGVPFDFPINEDTENFPLSQEGLARLQRGVIWMEIAQDEEGRVLIYNQPVLTNNRMVGIVQIARSLADRDRSLRSLRVALLSGS